MSDWTTTSIDEAVSLLRRGTAPVYVERSPVRAIGQRCVRSSGFNTSAARPHLESVPGAVEPQAGDVLLNSTGTGTIGRSCVFPGNIGKFMVDGHVTVLRARPEVADGRIVNEFLRSPEGQRLLESQCFTGSTNQVELSRGQLGKLKISLPPVEEQRRIAEILDTIDETIQATERVIAKRSALQTGVVDSFMNSPGEDWSLCKLMDACVLQRGFDITKAAQRPGPHPVVSSGGVSSFHDEWKVEGPGVVTGRKGLLGKVYFVDRDFWPHDTSLYVKDFRGNEPEFISLLLRYLRLERFDAASAVPTLNRNFIHPLPVRLPQVSGQRRLIALTRAAETQIETENIALRKLLKLRNGLAVDLLSGRVRTVAS